MTTLYTSINTGRVSGHIGRVIGYFTTCAAGNIPALSGTTERRIFILGKYRYCSLVLEKKKNL
jgi:hypothetical protein